MNDKPHYYKLRWDNIRTFLKWMYCLTAILNVDVLLKSSQILLSTYVILVFSVCCNIFTLFYTEVILDDVLIIYKLISWNSNKIHEMILHQLQS